MVLIRDVGGGDTGLGLVGAYAIRVVAVVYGDAPLIDHDELVFGIVAVGGLNAVDGAVGAIADPVILVSDAVVTIDSARDALAGQP